MYLIWYRIKLFVLLFYDRNTSVDGLDANINDPNNQLAIKQQIKV